MRTLVSGVRMPFAGVFKYFMLDFHFLILSRYTVMINRKRIHKMENKEMDEFVKE